MAEATIRVVTQLAGQRFGLSAKGNWHFHPLSRKRVSDMIGWWYACERSEKPGRGWGTPHGERES